MPLADHLAEVLSVSGQVDRRRYGALLTPLAFGFSGIGAVGLLMGLLLNSIVGGWIVILAIAGGMLLTAPSSVRRARDIGWPAVFPPIISVMAFVGIAAFISLVLPVSLGIWEALERTGVGLVWWGLLFAACIGLWSWCWMSLLDRPTKGHAAIEQAAPPPVERRRTPVWLLVVWVSFWGVVLVWNVVAAARHYLTGDGESPPLLGLLLVVSMIGVTVWDWQRRGTRR